MFCNRKTNRTRQLIGISFYKVIERLLQIELWIDLLRACSIENSRRLIGPVACRRYVKGNTITLYILYLIISRIGDNTITQNDIGTKDACKYLT